LIPVIIFIASFSSAEVIDKIVVVVNNEVITQREIDRMLFPVYEQYKTLYYGDELVKRLEEARQNIIDQLIEDRLLASEAKKVNIEVNDKDVAARIDEMRRRVGSKEQFERALGEQNLTESDLKKRYREQTMIRRLVDQKVGSTITMTPVEANDYYNAHKEEFIQPEQIKLLNILIKPNEYRPPDKAGDTAKTVLKRLQEGGDFAALAREYSEGPGASEGGLMGYVKKGDLMPEIEKVVFNMKPGEVSSILQTGLGYHIFKVEERLEPKTLGLSEVRRDVEESIYREKARKKLKSWIEGLKKNAYIAFK